MKKFGLIFAVLVLSACTDYHDVPAVEQPKPAPTASEGCDNMPKLTNDEIIRETRKCKASGLKAEPLHCGDDWQTTIIQCAPND